MTTQNQNEQTQDKRKARKLKPTDLITVMNYTTGELVYEPRSGNGRSLSLMEFGDTDELELSDLRTMKNSQPRILSEPWLYILDEDAIEYLGLSPLYEKVIKPEDVEKLFALNEPKLTEVLEKSPESVQLLIAQKAKEMISNRKLSDINVIKTIEKALNVELIER